MRWTNSLAQLDACILLVVDTWNFSFELLLIAVLEERIAYAAFAAFCLQTVLLSIWDGVSRCMEGGRLVIILQVPDCSCRTTRYMNILS